MKPEHLTAFSVFNPLKRYFSAQFTDEEWSTDVSEDMPSHVFGRLKFWKEVKS